jgi:hypothetical protein
LRKEKGIFVMAWWREAKPMRTHQVPFATDPAFLRRRIKISLDIVD